MEEEEAEVPITKRSTATRADVEVVEGITTEVEKAVVSTRKGEEVEEVEEVEEEMICTRC